MATTRKTPGIEVRHRKDCPAREGKRCRCQPSYRGQVWDAKAKRPLKGPWFRSQAAARGWRVDAQRREARRDDSRTVGEVVEEVLGRAEAGTVRNRSGDAFKASVLAGYRQWYESRVKPRFGPRKLGSISQPDLYAFVHELQVGDEAAGHRPLAAGSVRNVLMPLRLAFREAVRSGEVAANPTIGLQLPASKGRRERIADADEAAAILAALPVGDRPLWATALYAGLRRGELMALRWSHVDTEAGIIRVDADRGSYEITSGHFVAPKSRAAVRSVPIIARLAPYLADRGESDALVFGRTSDVPFAPKSVALRASNAWRAAEVEPIGLHECRHTFASYLIASGANAKAVSTALGHSSVAITFDRYGHLFPGHENELRGLLDTYLGPGSEHAPPAA